MSISLVAPWSRRTERLATLLTEIGLAQGGLPGSRLTKHLGILINRQTLLRLIMKTPTPLYEVPKVLGVDGRATKTCGMRLGESVIISEHLDELSSWRS